MPGIAVDKGRLFGHLAALGTSALAAVLLLNRNPASPTQWLYAAVLCALLLIVLRASYLSTPEPRSSKAFAGAATARRFRLPLMLAIAAIATLLITEFDLYERFSATVWMPLGILTFIACASMVIVVNVIRNGRRR